MTEILCVTHKHPPCIGGMEKQSYELVSGLSRYYKTHVIAHRNETNKTIWFLTLRAKIEKTLKENPNIRLIHLNDGSMGVACLWLLKQTKIPVIVTFHGLDMTLSSSIFQKILIPKLRNYSAAICVSEYTRKEALLRGFDENSTVTIKNGVDIGMGGTPVKSNECVEMLKTKYDIDVSQKRIVFTMGRPVKRKGFSWFLNNVLPLLDNDIVLLMAGPIRKNPSVFRRALQYVTGKISPTLQLVLGMDSDANNMLNALANTENAHHLGSVPYPDLLQLLSLADIFIMPNISVHGDEEGFGLVALEANMRGTFVLASGIEGIAEAVIDGKNGFHLPSGDTQAWTDKIHEVLNDGEALNLLSLHAKAYAQENYSWNRMVDNYKAVFDEYIENSGRNFNKPLSLEVWH